MGTSHVVEALLAVGFEFGIILLLILWVAAIQKRRLAVSAMTDIIIKDTHRGLWYEDGVLTASWKRGGMSTPSHACSGVCQRWKSSWWTCASGT